MYRSAGVDKKPAEQSFHIKAAGSLQLKELIRRCCGGMTPASLLGLYVFVHL